jgi:hypothetical protein
MMIGNRHTPAGMADSFSPSPQSLAKCENAVVIMITPAPAFVGLVAGMLVPVPAIPGEEEVDSSSRTMNPFPSDSIHLLK